MSSVKDKAAVLEEAGRALLEQLKEPAMVDRINWELARYGWRLVPVTLTEQLAPRDGAKRR
jgi:hypothetical protein